MTARHPGGATGPPAGPVPIPAEYAAQFGPRTITAVLLLPEHRETGPESDQSRPPRREAEE